VAVDLDRIDFLLSQRAASYELAVQTSVLGKTPAGWQNLLTKIELLRKDEEPPAPLAFEYPEVRIIRRLVPIDDVEQFLRRLIVERTLDIEVNGHAVELPTEFSVQPRTRWAHSEWSTWPADVFALDPRAGQSWPPHGSLISVAAPYFPSLGQVLVDLFAIRSQSWGNYFRGQIIIVLPDFRARIARLSIAMRQMRVALECGTLPASALVVKIYAEGHIGPLLQETIKPLDVLLEFDLKDQPTLACAALVSAHTGETLDERVFQEGISSLERGVVVEAREPEVEQLIARGEGESVEFKEALDKGKPEKLAKTAVAFANTNGGSILFGVNDEARIVGCQLVGLADRVTNILRSHCDPPIGCKTTVVNCAGTDVLLVGIAASSLTVHVVKDQGPFIRANRTNRSPTAAELADLYVRRADSGIGFGA
jgi:hypothetical protein